MTYDQVEQLKRAEKANAARLGFYPKAVWWIDSFTVHPGRYYPFHIHGRNDMRGGEDYSWTVPSVAGSSYAFALKPIR